MELQLLKRKAPWSLFQKSGAAAFDFTASKNGGGEATLNKWHPGTWMVLILSTGSLGVSYGLEKLGTKLIPMFVRARLKCVRMASIAFERCHRMPCTKSYGRCWKLKKRCDEFAESISDTESTLHVRDPMLVMHAKNNSGLVKLDLSHCIYVTGAGIRDMLMAAHALKTLDVSSCQLTAESVALIAKAVTFIVSPLYFRFVFSAITDLIRPPVRRERKSST
jgi:hypothetical protein